MVPQIAGTRMSTFSVPRLENPPMSAPILPLMISIVDGPFRRVPPSLKVWLARWVSSGQRRPPGRFLVPYILAAVVGEAAPVHCRDAVHRQPQPSVRM
jgi:hypothetical protein